MFDEEPEDPHGECRNEIKRLQAEVERLAAGERALARLNLRVTAERDDLRAEVERLTRERDELRDELRDAIPAMMAGTVWKDRLRALAGEAPPMETGGNDGE